MALSKESQAIMDRLIKMTREHYWDTEARGRIVDELEAQYGADLVAECWRDLMEYRQEQGT